ncbi:hypothetical protein [Yersinia massiliensis]|uniref:hypothetical protein n=1 Tax=Yersinia massiliensis TaxID=419257 RepID=UPI0011A69F11|nr:hypothetical protein [Yersinia massiliensis]
MSKISTLARNIVRKFDVNNLNKSNCYSLNGNIVKGIKTIKNIPDSYTVIYKSFAIDHNNNPVGITNSFSGTKEAGLILHGRKSGELSLCSNPKYSDGRYGLNGEALKPIHLVKLIISRGINPQSFGSGALNLIACYSGQSHGGVGQTLANIIQRPVVTYGNNETLSTKVGGVRSMSNENYKSPRIVDSIPSSDWTKFDRAKIANRHTPREDLLAKVIMKNILVENSDSKLISFIKLILNDMVKYGSNECYEKLLQSADVIRFMNNHENKSEIRKLIVTALSDLHNFSNDELVKLKSLSLSVHMQIDSLPLSKQNLAKVRNIFSNVKNDSSKHSWFLSVLPELQEIAKKGDVRELMNKIEQYKGHLNLA